MEKLLAQSLDMECSFFLALVFPQALLQLLRCGRGRRGPCVLHSTCAVEGRFPPVFYSRRTGLGQPHVCPEASPGPGWECPPGVR